MTETINALLLEDDELDAAVTKELLQNCCKTKFTVKHCNFLIEAVQELKRGDYPVALIDMNVPDSKGLNTVSEILNTDSETAIIVLTGTDDTETAVKALEIGAQDYLPKNALDSRALERIIQYSIQRKSKETDLTAKAYYDSLTGLGNRALLYERWRRSLSRSKRATRMTGVLIIDVDQFKKVNDTFGHHAGDLLLQDLSARLRESVRDTDVAARLGGDEFVIVLENICGKAEIDAVRDKLMEKKQYSYHFDGQEIHYGVSIGGTISDPAEREDLMSALRRADVEMYEFKELRRKQVDEEHPTAAAARS